MAKWVLVLLAVVVSSCSSESALSQNSHDKDAEAAQEKQDVIVEGFKAGEITVQDIIATGMSKTTEAVLKSDKDFCSDENRALWRREGVTRLDTHAFPEKVLRDITVDAICLDGQVQGYDGHYLAVETALVAQTYDFSFEYENLLYSMIATSGKSTDALKAWAYHHMSNKKLDLVAGYEVKKPDVVTRGRRNEFRSYFLNNSHPVAKNEKE